MSAPDLGMVGADITADREGVTVTGKVLWADPHGVLVSSGDRRKPLVWIAYDYWDVK